MPVRRAAAGAVHDGANDVKRGGGYLEDLGVRVPVETGFRYTTIGRVACGWAVYAPAPATPSKAESGVLSTSGEYTSFGQTTGEGMAFSPDGTELVYVSPTNDHKAELRVVEVATGKETAGYADGREGRGGGLEPGGNLVHAGPGRGADEAVEAGLGAGVGSTPARTALTAYRTTDRVLLSDRASTERGQLRAGGRSRRVAGAQDTPGEVW